jgi:hypothetical protein
VPTTCALEIEMIFGRLKKDTNHQLIIKSLQYLLKQGVENFIKLINFIWNKEELPEELKESIIVSAYKKGYKTDCSN